MNQTTQQTPAVKPVTGSVRWIRKMVLPHGIGRLAITSNTTRGLVTAEYDVGCHLDQQGNVLGYRLVKDDDEGYDVPADLSSCSCADAVYRSRACKHIRALQVALPRCSVTI